MGKKITLENIFAFRGQIMLVEKMKGKESCRCGLCERPKRNLRDKIWYDARIDSSHYDVVKIFIPMSKTKFKELQKTYEKSFDKKEAHELFLKNQRDSMNPKRRKFPEFRLYPLHKSVYDEFANYVWNKFERPQFNKKGHTIEGIEWGDGESKERTTKKYGTWVHKRTLGLQIYKGHFEFVIDNHRYNLSTKTKNIFRKKNKRIFRKKPGKLV
jgi:hypothetical protein